MAAGRRDITKRYRFVKREPLQNEQKKGDYRPNSDRIIPREVSRQETRDGGGNGWTGTKVRPYPEPQQGAKPPSPKGKWWSCGGNHYSNDPICPNNKTRAPIMYHGREVVNDNEEEGQKSSESKQSGSKSSEETSEQFKQIVDSDAEDEIVDGVQYDSEYTLEECSEYSDYDDDERCYRVNVEDSGENDTPELESVSDSDEESECDFSDSERPDTDPGIGSDESVELPPPQTNLKPKPKQRELCLEELGLFGVCDDYSDDEFVTEEDVDKLAKEMAKYLMETRDPEQVVEYFSAGRERSEKDSTSQSGQKRGVYLKRTKKPRPRPARTSENAAIP
ncbi:hypothetical protein R3P38DRAFT_3229045 [Favolaschia claudopus]|uniref:Uncharacterized protein n=1 Tax=Favolaschia claudopus TaxID=2862362 RepID=A0AAV9ZQ50_9AGAR